MRIRLATAIAALACTGLGQASERVREPPAMIYHCDHTIQNLEGTNGRLYLTKQFRRDGSPLGLFVELEGSSGAIAHFRTPGNRIDMTLRWRATISSAWCRHRSAGQTARSRSTSTARRTALA